MSTEISGYVEFYGYHSIAGGWFFSGWISNRPGLADRFKDISAWFDDESITGPVCSMIFPRDDLKDTGSGFLVFIQSNITPSHPLSRIRIGVGPMEQDISPVIDAPILPETMLNPQLGFLIAKSTESPQRAEIERLLTGEVETGSAGFIEYFGYHHAAGGWFINGWVERGWSDDQQFDHITMCFENENISVEPVLTAYPREDLPLGAHGVILFLRTPQRSLTKLLSASLYRPGVLVSLTPIDSVPQYREAELTARLKSSLAVAWTGLGSDRINDLLSRHHYAGEDTLDSLSPAINLQVEEAIRCGTEGLVLIGWILAKPNEISEIRLHCGEMTVVVRPSAFLKVERPDIHARLAVHGFEDSACGFVSYVAGEIEPDAPIYLEIETRRQQTAFHNVPRPIRSGLAAIKHLLSLATARFADIRPAFDQVIGPAVEALNQERLAVPAGYQVVEYGSTPQTPTFSVIIPLHGRLDFVEYQQALFSARPESASVEFIYILDDPPKRREAQGLFRSVHERFQIPFRVIMLDQNVGFAPANNFGLRHAHGEFVAYLNSDVFPGTPDWLERLSTHFEENPQLGAIGPKLLFEDGSIQHRGMYFQRLAEYGDWYFCKHYDKGLRNSGPGDLQYFPAITGACMVLRRQISLQIGGFDESYIIGDFEDSDMCLKLQRLGLKCAVDSTVHMYHLERKSYLNGDITFRTSLTAYNAWKHDRRWASTITWLQARTHGRLS